jgi:hypothetical protein
VESSEPTPHILSPARFPIKRTQRYPQYSDHELAPWFAEIAKGFCFEQAAERCKLVWPWVQNTFYSDDEVMAHGLELSMVAGALIRAGKLPIPARHDGLYRGVK